MTTITQGQRGEKKIMSSPDDLIKIPIKDACIINYTQSVFPSGMGLTKQKNARLGTIFQRQLRMKMVGYYLEFYSKLGDALPLKKTGHRCLVILHQIEAKSVAMQFRLTIRVHRRWHDLMYQNNRVFFLRSQRLLRL